MPIGTFLRVDGQTKIVRSWLYTYYRYVLSNDLKRPIGQTSSPKKHQHAYRYISID